MLEIIFNIIKLSTIFILKILFVFLLLILPFVLWDIITETPQSRCLSEEHGVWDYEQNICRHDCRQWTQENGCIPLSEK